MYEIFVSDAYYDSDSSITIDYTAPTNTSNGRIAARWSTTLPNDNQTDVDFTVSAAVQLAMLDIVVEVPPEIEELAITKGLMGRFIYTDIFLISPLKMCLEQCLRAGHKWGRF